MTARIASVDRTSKEYKLASAVQKLQTLGSRQMSKSELKLIEDYNDVQNINGDAIILYLLKEQFGFSSEDLLKLFHSCRALLKELSRGTDGIYGLIPQVASLKEECGIDLVSLYEEETS